MSLPTEDDEIVAYVRSALAALDTTPTVPRWRQRAGGLLPDALASAPHDVRLSLKVPVAEARLLRVVAEERDLGRETVVRRAVGTWMVAVAGYDVRQLPYFTKGGLLL